MISTPVEKIVAKLMRQYADAIDAGNSHLNAEQATNIRIESYWLPRREN